VVVQETGDLEFYLTIAALPITVVIFALALFWVRRESLWGMVTTIVSRSQNNTVSPPRLIFTPVPLSARPRLLLRQAIPHVVRTCRQGGRLHTRTTVIDHFRCAYNMPTHHYGDYCNNMHTQLQPRTARQTNKKEVAHWRRCGAADAAPCGADARTADY